jgi:uncharacterized NAD(P)/FAD-binding protein YdhS
MENSRSSVIIVGGGASAVFVTAALRDRARAVGAVPPRVTVIGHEPDVGRGLAYGRADAHHRLNSPAGKMSLSATDDPAFLRWLDGAGWRDVDGSSADGWTFVPRRVFGDYVAASFQALLDDPDSGVAFVQGDVADVSTSADAATVLLATGERLVGDQVVLALGNPAPGDVPSAATTVIGDPWAPGALDGIDSEARVLLIGTGLTMIDVATSLARKHPGIRLTATSRHLLLPEVHLGESAPAGPGIDGDLATLREMIAAFRSELDKAETAGSPWQTVMDGVRPQIQTLWQALSIPDRRRFVAHVARRWDTARHRMAPVVAAELKGLLDAGTLTLAGGVDHSRYDVAVNCTGPRSVARKGWNPLVDALLDAGDAASDPLGLGLDADASGALRDATGAVNDRLFTIGSALKGALWETVAIGEIRLVASRIADRILETAPVAA